MDEAVFEEQVEAGDREQVRFLEYLDRIERYMEDQVLLMRRRLLDLDDELEKAEGRRDQAIGPDARGRAEEQLKRLDAEREVVSRAAGAVRGPRRPGLSHLAAGRPLDRRAQTPTVTHLLDFSFTVE